MTHFVMVITQITSEQFKKLISIQVKSQDKIKFFPQATNSLGVNTQGFSSQVQQVNRNGKVTQEQVYSNVRLEWNDDAAEFARELFDMFIKTDQEEQQKAG